MNRLRFLHIPKTAGTAFVDCLSRLYPGGHFAFSGELRADMERYARLDPVTRDRIALVSGHAPRITGAEGIDNIPTVTFLRDPIRRVMSYCQHVSEGKSPELVAAFPPETFDLDRFLAVDNVQLSNLHTRMLLGRATFDLPARDSRSLIEETVRVLTDDLRAFGIVEHFDQSLIMFRRTFGWKHVFARRLNEQGTRLLSFNEDQLKRIRDLNAIDVEVYRVASSIFRERLGGDTVSMQRELFRFRLSQDLRRLPFRARGFLYEIRRRFR